jgi:transposase
MTNSRAEVITSVERRRRRPEGEKERLVAASLEPGASVSEVARSAGLHVSQLFKWRKELCKRNDTSVAGLVPVKIEPSPPKQLEAPSTAVAGRRRKKDGIIEIELGSGHRVRVDCDVDGDALRRVLDALVRR